MNSFRSCERVWRTYAKREARVRVAEHVAGCVGVRTRQINNANPLRTNYGFTNLWQPARRVQVGHVHATSRATCCIHAISTFQHSVSIWLACYCEFRWQFIVK